MRYIRILTLLIAVMIVGIMLFSHADPASAQACDAQCREEQERAKKKEESGSEASVKPVPQCYAGYTYLPPAKEYRGPLQGDVEVPGGCYKDGKRSGERTTAQYTCSDPSYNYDTTTKTCYHPSRPPEGSGIASTQQRAEETYSRFDGALDGLQNTFFTGKGRHLCSSQGCNTNKWKDLVYQCVEQTRTTVVGAGRYGEKIDDDKLKDLFSDCFSTSTGIGKQRIKDNVKDVDFDKVFGGKAAAGEKACLESGGIWKAPNCEPKKEDASREQGDIVQCSIEDGVGWLVCPVMRFMARVMDSSFNFLSNHFLKTDVRLLNDSRGQTRQAWGMMQQLANISFVVIFLVIIYSQITGAGIGAYHIKTILPRLFIAAVLVNTSFILCQLAVDVSNILGFSLKEFFDGLGRAILVSDPTGDTTSARTQALSAVTTIGVVLAAAGGAAALIMALSFPVLLAGVLALGLIALILIGRTALIIILTIIAPLAFAAWVLPNTRSLFSKWGKMFFSLLMLFPIISVVFGASNFVAGLLQGLSEEDNQGIMSLMALAVTSIPLFVVPGLLKGALNATGQIGAKLSGVSSSLNSRVGSKVKDSSRLGEAWKQQKFKSIQRQAQRRAGNSSFARFGRQLSEDTSKGWRASLKRGAGRVLSAKGDMTRAIDSSPLGGLIGGAAGAASAAATAAEAENKQVEQMATLMMSGVDPSETHGMAKQQLEKAIRSKDAIKARAAQKILLSQGAKGTDTLQEVYKAMENESGYDSSSDLARSLKSDLNGAGLKGKDAVLANWAYNGKTMEATQNDSSVFTGLNAVELAGQSASNLDQGVNIQAIRQSDYDRIKNSDAASSLLTGEKEVHLQRAKP